MLIQQHSIELLPLSLLKRIRVDVEKSSFLWKLHLIFEKRPSLKPICVVHHNLLVREIGLSFPILPTLARFLKLLLVPGQVKTLGSPLQVGSESPLLMSRCRISLNSLPAPMSLKREIFATILGLPVDLRLRGVCSMRLAGGGHPSLAH